MCHTRSSRSGAPSHADTTFAQTRAKVKVWCCYSWRNCCGVFCLLSLPVFPFCLTLGIIAVSLILDMINIHLVSHSHMDPGWRLTLEDVRQVTRSGAFAKLNTMCSIPVLLGPQHQERSEYG